MSRYVLVIGIGVLQFSQFSINLVSPGDFRQAVFSEKFYLTRLDAKGLADDFVNFSGTCHQNLLRIEVS